MMRSASHCRGFAGPRPAYTLVEILVATTISLVMLGAVIAAFATVMAQMTDTRALLETIDRLRSAGDLLRKDLEGVTVTPLPPRDPKNQEGYLEWTEGPMSTAAIPPSAPSGWAVNLNEFDTNNPNQYERDSTVGDVDDILMFTTRREDTPFVGRCLDGAGNRIEITSQVAEVAWFVRGNRLYRRVLLVAPEMLEYADQDGNRRLAPNEWGANQNYYGWFDVAARWEYDPATDQLYLIPCTLGDLTKPENRYAHQSGGYPFHPHRVNGWQPLGLPTLAESTSPAAVSNWLQLGELPTITLTPRAAPYDQFDAWTNPFPYEELDPLTGQHTAFDGARVEEDLVLTNVIGFDVKGWDPEAPLIQLHDSSSGTSVAVLTPGDPGYLQALGNLGSTVGGIEYQLVGRGAYVDLNYAGDPAISLLSGPADPRSGFGNNLYVYDTGSTHYEKDGIDNNGSGVIDTGTDGFDNNGDGQVDELAEWETVPGYPVPLRGIQVTIRVFEPDSRQVRQVTLTQDFLPQ